MRFDAASHARTSLIAVLGILLASTLVGNARHSAPGWHGLTAPRVDPLLTVASADFAGHSDWPAKRFLQSVLRRPPSLADSRRVLSYLDHPDWLVVGLAYRVLQTHRHPDRHRLQIRLLERALGEIDASWSETYYRRESRGRVLCDVVAGIEPAAVESCRPILVHLVQRCPESRVRARGLELLSVEITPDVKQLVLDRLDDSSERVRMVALDCIARLRWSDACPSLEPLASSPRPALRRRAAEVLELFAWPYQPDEYGECVWAEAHGVADRLWHAGLQYGDVVPHTNREPDGLDSDRLQRSAEEHLDQTSASDARSRDPLGILFLAAVVRSGQRKLSLRLWEHAVACCDSEEELVERGLETIARNRLLSGLAAYHSGDRAESLKELASMTKLQSAARPGTALAVYIQHASDLSTAIWQSNANQTVGSHQPSLSRELDPVYRLAARILDQLDLTCPDDRIEARLRLDTWCRLTQVPPIGRRATPTASFAN